MAKLLQLRFFLSRNCCNYVSFCDAKLLQLSFILRRETVAITILFVAKLLQLSFFLSETVAITFFFVRNCCNYVSFCVVKLLQLRFFLCCETVAIMFFFLWRQKNMARSTNKISKNSNIFMPLKLKKIGSVTTKNMSQNVSSRDGE